MDDFFKSVTDAIAQLNQYLPISAGFIVLLFLIHIVNWMVGYRLNILGIWPRKKWGWIGIPFSPFLHGNFGHLIVNSVPLFIFSNLILLQGLTNYLIVSAIIILLSGFLIWLFGRRGIHIGASALIMGYLGYITIGIYYKPSPLSFIVGIVAVFYFSSMFTNLLPSNDKRISWEGHLFGFIAGVSAVYLLPYVILLLPHSY
ncbi:MAG: rhomboid family intramembrane serine protease [Coxiellaceae bacterium]|nr:rhomboid family intramembrane serine protease [Coxiellaceae bacterium]